MSDRERWIVYPLLFLALGVALRDKFTREIETNSLICDRLIVRQELAVIDESQRKLITASVETGQPLGQSLGQAAGKSRRYGAIRVGTDDGRSLAQLGPISTCKALVLVGDGGRPLVSLGVEDLTVGGARTQVGVVKAYDSQGHTYSELGPVMLCRELHVINPQVGDRLVSLGAVPVRSDQGVMLAGRMTVQGPFNQPLVALGADDTATGGVITTQSRGGTSQVVLRSGSMGGYMTIEDSAEQIKLLLGHFDRESGLAAITRDGAPLHWLPLVQRPGMPPEPREPAVTPDRQ